MKYRAILLAVALAAGTAATANAGDKFPFNPHHSRLVPNGHGGFNVYDHQGYRGFINENGYYDNEGEGWTSWGNDD
jgi:hypothetical protein